MLNEQVIRKGSVYLSALGGMVNELSRIRCPEGFCIREVIYRLKQVGLAGAVLAVKKNALPIKIEPPVQVVAEIGKLNRSEYHEISL
jgi:hypothetical protein